MQWVNGRLASSRTLNAIFCLFVQTIQTVDVGPTDQSIKDLAFGLSTSIVTGDTAQQQHDSFDMQNFLKTIQVSAIAKQLCCWGGNTKPMVRVSALPLLEFS